MPVSRIDGTLGLASISVKTILHGRLGCVRMRAIQPREYAC